MSGSASPAPAALPPLRFEPDASAVLAALRAAGWTTDGVRWRDGSYLFHPVDLGGPAEQRFCASDYSFAGACGLALAALPRLPR